MLDRLQSWLPKRADITANAIGNVLVSAGGGALAVVGAWALSWLAAPTSDRDWVNYFLLSLVVFGFLWMAIAIGWRRLYPLPTVQAILVNRDVATEVPGTRLPFNQPPVSVGVLDPHGKTLPQPKRPPSTREIDEMLEASKLVLDLLNETDDTIEFVHETKHKVIAFPTHRDNVEPHLFDLQRCRTAVAEIATKAQRIYRQNQQHADLIKPMVACPANSVTGAVERLRKSVHLMSTLALAAAQKTGPTEYAYLLQPFVTDLDAQLAEFSTWNQRTREHIIAVRKGLGH